MISDDLKKEIIQGFKEYIHESFIIKEAWAGYLAGTAMLIDDKKVVVDKKDLRHIVDFMDDDCENVSVAIYDIGTDEKVSFVKYKNFKEHGKAFYYRNKTLVLEKHWDNGIVVGARSYI